MDNDLKLEITIKTKDNDEKLKIWNAIHEQLIGNKDYIYNNIILNIDTNCTVKIWIYEECENIPQIVLTGGK